MPDVVSDLSYGIMKVLEKELQVASKALWQPTSLRILVNLPNTLEGELLWRNCLVMHNFKMRAVLNRRFKTSRAAIDRPISESSDTWFSNTRIHRTPLPRPEPAWQMFMSEKRGLDEQSEQRGLRAYSTGAEAAQVIVNHKYHKFEFELKLIQTRMAQKPISQEEVYARKSNIQSIILLIQ